MVPATARRLRDVVRAHPFAAYVGLAWATSWAYWLAMLARGDVVVPGGPVSHFPGLFGPMVAAFVVTSLAAGRAGVADLLRRMFRWRVALRWYALAALPFGLFLLGVAVLAVTGGTPPSVDDLASYSGLPLVGLPLVVCAAFLGNGFGEEVGWRGFAQPTLERRMSFLRASVTVAIVWAIWHVPSFPVIETYRTMGLAIVPIFVFGLGSGAIVLGWLYDRSGGSILIAALFHLGLNMGSATLAGRGLPSALATTGIMIWAAAIVIVELRRGRVGPSAGGMARSRLASVRDGAVRLLLASPLRSIAGRGMLLLTYRGRRTGRTYTTPVEFVREGDRLLVLVGAAERKQWWRNVQAAPEVTVLLDGRIRRAKADVVTGAAARADADAYVAHRPRSARSVAAAGSGLVVVRLEVA
jgi:deazaflavin-dependent oxidoreductase (nitroreductase family)